MIYYSFFNQSTLPQINDRSDLIEFLLLAQYLSFDLETATTREYEHNDSKIIEIQNTFYQSSLYWIDPQRSLLLIKSWLIELDRFIHLNPISFIELIQQSCVITSRPKLLELPLVYEELFMFYHSRSCKNCNTIPNDPSICLVCGDIVCMRDTCCRKNNLSEGVAHSKECGSGIALFLSINSSTIIVIHGRKACSWGSVYLDSFGEEDRDLKRGKPLFLCSERYSILQEQWLSHSLLNLNVKWVSHLDMI
ncbi:hypothetical protein NH340_JMT08725 [Sarcoptes scabiei]|nr:hypothetical protein NH340_JMT08725 [Sarcoptes scabiei]